MQETMDRIGHVRTPGGRDVRLAIKVSVAVGRARRFVVGDPTVQLVDVLAGGCSTSSPTPSTVPRKATSCSPRRP